MFKLQKGKPLKKQESTRIVIFLKLDSLAMVPITHFETFRNRTDIFVIPEYCFGVNVHDEIQLSAEHTEYRWVDFETAMHLLKWDSNKTALWELDARLSRSICTPDKRF
nr:hypothetical protein [Paenibacillus sp. HW567]